MTDMTVFRKVVPFLEDVFGAEGADITPETDLFEDLYADKMDIVELSLIIEEEFGFLADDDELAEVSTVAQLCDYISQHTA